MCPFGKHAREFFEMLPDCTKHTFLFDVECAPIEIDNDPNNSHVQNDKQGLLNHCRARDDWYHDMVDFFL